MSFDFQSAVDAAREVVRQQESRENGEGNYKYPLLYPPKGSTITLRILFNPKSGKIVRLVNRHEKVPCYRTYGIECPICKTMQEVKDMTGNDPFGRSKSSKSRGIAFAQFVSSTVPIDKGGNRGNFSPGEYVLFMFPWSVYSQLNAAIQAISQAPVGMDQAFCHADTGLFVNITVSDDFRYTTTQNPYLTFNPFGKSDDEFIKELEDMESLDDQVLPATITEEIDKQVKEYTDSIYRQYIAPRTPTYGVPQGTAPVNAGQVPTSTGDSITSHPTSAGSPSDSEVYDVPPWQSQTPSNSTNSPSPNSPACFGCHEMNSTKCMPCPLEVQCMEASKK